MGPPGAPPPILSSSTVITPPYPQQQQQAKHQQNVLSHANYHNNASNTRIVSLAPPRLHDVRLTVVWLHHSSARTLETVRPSLRALQDAALAYVHNNPHAFENLTAADMALPPDPHPRAILLLKRPRPRPCPCGQGRAWFDDESWDLANYRGGDDLTRLFASLGQGTIPRLEIEVDYPRP
ncbi:hypothetical protein PG999_005755 [Apiospora kogelbergensis]|uniref:Uncharacterized protein n=1 Tax=Apiospora kogelbergensis TaxID=1337665 RepID=A0AAW0QUU7_9PEZI